MGRRAGFRFGGLVVSGNAADLEKLRRALIDEFEDNGTIDDILSLYSLSLVDIRETDIDTSRLSKKKKYLALVGDYDKELSLDDLGVLHTALHIIADYVEPLPNTYLAYSNSDGIWYYLPKITAEGNCEIVSVNGKVEYDDYEAEPV